MFIEEDGYQQRIAFQDMLQRDKIAERLRWYHFGVSHHSVINDCGNYVNQWDIVHQILNENFDPDDWTVVPQNGSYKSVRIRKSEDANLFQLLLSSVNIENQRYI